MNPEALLLRLLNVKRTGSDRWIARCPAHKDRTPSLSVAASATGAILLHCWTGCELTDITRALGIEVRDLFPRDERELTPQERRTFAEQRRAVGWAAALRVLAFEGAVVLAASGDLLNGRSLSPPDHSRLREAVARIEQARAALA